MPRISDALSGLGSILYTEIKMTKVKRRAMPYVHTTEANTQTNPELQAYER